MSHAMHEVLAMPEVKEQFEKVGVEPHASTPEELMGRLKSDIKKWNRVMAETGMAKK